MDQKKFLIDDYVHGNFDITELAVRYGVSRKTTYKWIRRFEQQGKDGLSTNQLLATKLLYHAAKRTSDEEKILGGT